MFAKSPDKEIVAVRRFNRYYARRLRQFDRDVVEGSLSRVELGMLGEIALAVDDATPSWLEYFFGVDAARVSRTLARLRADGWITDRRDVADLRFKRLSLTKEGIERFKAIDFRANERIIRLLVAHERRSRTALVDAMWTIERILERYA